jgi:Protein of unknown function (DUF732)
MRRLTISTGALTAAAMFAGFLTAPAHADQWSYVSELDSKGVYYQNILEIIDTGKAVCHYLRSDYDIDGVFDSVHSIGYSYTEAGAIVGAAVLEMCPDQKSVVRDWLAKPEPL